MVNPSTDRLLVQRFADQMFSRAAGAALVGGNAVRVLRDGTENFPAWEEAIAGAGATIHIEMYIFRHDRTGLRFVDLLARRARAGVEVRVLYDWFGSGLSAARGVFRPLLEAGGEVRASNPPSIRAPLGWVSRNHRKLIVVDGRVAFVSGLCIGREWEGVPDKGREPWRDTGVELIGPVVADAEHVFAASWRRAGGVIPVVEGSGARAARAGDIDIALDVGVEGERAADERTVGTQTAGGNPASAAPVNVRLISTEPFAANLLRMDLLVCSLARRTLWITDAYFIGSGSYVDALRRASEDGVDVRLLLPRGSDVGWTVPVSRSLYRPLLESGVRIFEWQGTMIHAKTAVADGLWSRVGSTNLNLNGWVGNWELDVAIEDKGVAGTMEGHYLEDLTRSTEIFAELHFAPRRPAVWLARRRWRPRSAQRMARTATRFGTAIGAVVLGRRALETMEAKPIVGMGLALLTGGAVLFLAPRLVAWPLAVIAAWGGIVFLVDAAMLWRRRPRRTKDTSAGSD